MIRRFAGILVLAMSATPATVEALDPPALVPRPAELRTMRGAFTILPDTPVVVVGDVAEARPVAEYLTEQLGRAVGRRLPLVPSSRSVTAPPVTLALEARLADKLGPEGYELRVSPNWIMLHAARPAGLFYGVQTLRQLADQARLAGDAVTIPGLRIVDYPRYRWRGMLLDCGRHFMDKQFIKRYIDLLAYHKMNVLHWHLTEDQGWRIEIRKYPKLTEIGAWRKATRDDEQPRNGDLYGGYYSQDDVREIVAYAASRYVTVVPEIEMPGHCMAALASYPELSCTGGPFDVMTRWGISADVYCAGKEKTFEFLESVLSEVIELFPSQYIHIGGDECPKTRWKECRKCQARIRAEGLKDEQELQSYFIRRIEEFLGASGRRIIGWDEILEGGLAPDATVQSWRGMRGAVAAATAGHDVIASPTSHCYLDYAQYRAVGEPTNMGYLPLERCYSFEPTPTELTPEQAEHVLGLEGNMWTEHAAQNRIDWQVFPRLSALSEVGWTPKRLRNYEDFLRRMQTHYHRLDALGVTYFIAPPGCLTAERVFKKSIGVRLHNPLGFGIVRYTLDGSDPSPQSYTYTGPVPLERSAVLKARTWLPNGRTSPIASYEFRQLDLIDSVSVSDARPQLRYEYYEGSWRFVPEFDQLEPVARGTCETFNLAVRKRDDMFALRFHGLIRIDRPGLYTFYLTSDDGSRLRLHGRTIVDNDGLHSRQTVPGPVLLRGGMHPIEVVFFELRGREVLKVEYQGPDMERREIPADVLFHQP